MKLLYLASTALFVFSSLNIVSAQTSQTLSALEAQAGRNDPTAIIELARTYFEGIGGVPRDPGRAEAILRRLPENVPENIKLQASQLAARIQSARVDVVQELVGSNRAAVPKPTAAEIVRLVSDSAIRPVNLPIRQSHSPIELRAFRDEVLNMYPHLAEGTGLDIRPVRTETGQPRFEAVLLSVRNEGVARALCGLLELQRCELQTPSSTQSRQALREPPTRPDPTLQSAQAQPSQIQRPALTSPILPPARPQGGNPASMGDAFVNGFFNAPPPPVNSGMPPIEVDQTMRRNDEASKALEQALAREEIIKALAQSEAAGRRLAEASANDARERLALIQREFSERENRLRVALTELEKAKSDVANRTREQEEAVRRLSEIEGSARRDRRARLNLEILRDEAASSLKSAQERENQVILIAQAAEAAVNLAEKEAENAKRISDAREQELNSVRIRVTEILALLSIAEQNSERSKIELERTRVELNRELARSETLASTILINELKSKVSTEQNQKIRKEMQDSIAELENKVKISQGKIDESVKEIERLRAALDSTKSEVDFATRAARVSEELAAKQIEARIASENEIKAAVLARTLSENERNAARLALEISNRQSLALAEEARTQNEQNRLIRQANDTLTAKNRALEEQKLALENEKRAAQALAEKEKKEKEEVQSRLLIEQEKSAQEALIRSDIEKRMVSDRENAEKIRIKMEESLELEKRSREALASELTVRNTASNLRESIARATAAEKIKLEEELNRVTRQLAEMSAARTELEKRVETTQRSITEAMETIRSEGLEKRRLQAEGEEALKKIQDKLNDSNQNLEKIQKETIEARIFLDNAKKDIVQRDIAVNSLNQMLATLEKNKETLALSLKDSQEKVRLEMAQKEIAEKALADLKVEQNKALATMRESSKARDVAASEIVRLRDQLASLEEVNRLQASSLRRAEELAAFRANQEKIAIEQVVNNSKNRVKEIEFQMVSAATRLIMLEKEIIDNKKDVDIFSEQVAKANEERLNALKSDAEKEKNRLNEELESAKTLLASQEKTAEEKIKLAFDEGIKSVQAEIESLRNQVRIATDLAVNSAISRATSNIDNLPRIELAQALPGQGQGLGQGQVPGMGQGGAGQQRSQREFPPPGGTGSGQFTPPTSARPPQNPTVPTTLRPPASAIPPANPLSPGELTTTERQRLQQRTMQEGRTEQRMQQQEQQRLMREQQRENSELGVQRRPQQGGAGGVPGIGGGAGGNIRLNEAPTDKGFFARLASALGFSRKERVEVVELPTAQMLAASSLPNGQILTTNNMMVANVEKPESVSDSPETTDDKSQSSDNVTNNEVYEPQDPETAGHMAENREELETNIRLSITNIMPAPLNVEIPADIQKAQNELIASLKELEEAEALRVREALARASSPPRRAVVNTGPAFSSTPAPPLTERNVASVAQPPQRRENRQTANQQERAPSPANVTSLDLNEEQLKRIRSVASPVDPTRQVKIRPLQDDEVAQAEARSRQLIPIEMRLPPGFSGQGTGTQVAQNAPQNPVPSPVVALNPQGPRTIQPSAIGPGSNPMQAPQIQAQAPTPPPPPQRAVIASVDGAENARLEVNRLRMAIPSNLLSGVQVFSEPMGNNTFRVGVTGFSDPTRATNFCNQVRSQGESCQVR